MEGTRPIALAGYLAGQLALLALLALTLARSSSHGPLAITVAGWVLVALGLAIALVSSRAMRGSFTPWPAPRADGKLHTGGPFRLVRHPVYSGLLAASVGVVLVRPGLLQLAMLAAFVTLLTRKAQLEERLLRARFKGYAAYAAETGMFLPRSTTLRP